MNNIVRVDVEKSGIQYKEKCKTCNYPEEIIGGFVIILLTENRLPDGFYTTDVYWRTHYLFGSMTVIGLETYQKLKEQKFKGLDLVKKVF